MSHRWFRRGLAAALAGGLTSLPTPAAAWYFSEHVVLAKDAVEQLTPHISTIFRPALERARAEGLALCTAVDVGFEELSATTPLRTRMVHSELGVDCVPFAALPALAADHADGVTELRGVLRTKKGLEITTAAAYEWRRFREAVDKSRSEALQRAAFVHELDVDFYFIDPGYEVRAQRTRSHFVDAGRPLDEIVRNAGNAGAVDNAIGQLLGHHLRSLQLAARGQPVEALLEHGFAVHFLEDAFSAGHLVMTDRTWARGNTYTRRRHDFFNSGGLRVQRALSVESCAALDLSFEAGAPPCWTTTGDGYLGIEPDSTDRVQAARAVKTAQLELAIALDSSKVIRFMDGLGEREQVALADLLDPVPWWTLPRRARRRQSATAERARRLVRGVAAAIDKLRDAEPVPALVVGRRGPARLFDPESVASSLDPCTVVSAPASAPSPSEDADDDGCGVGRSLLVGSIGASLLRPLLVELPATQADVAQLEGQAATDHGLAYQLMASLGTGAMFPSSSPAQFYAPWLSVGMGLAYRFGNYLPGRRNRAALELNVAISSAIQVDTTGRAGGNPLVTMFEQEVRWPIFWEVLTSYALPFRLRDSHSAGGVIILGGARVRQMLKPTPRIWGIEHEIVAIALSNGSGAYPLYSSSPELRFSFGFADPSAAHESVRARWAPTLNVTLTGGYATFF